MVRDIAEAPDDDSTDPVGVAHITDGSGPRLRSKPSLWKRVTRECNSATRIRGIGKKSSKKQIGLDLGQKQSPVGGGGIRPIR